MKIMSDVIDLETLQTLKEAIGGEEEPEVWREVITTFLEDAPEDIEQIRSAIAENNPSILRDVAHNLKSNSASLGALSLSELSKQLELFAKGEQECDPVKVSEKLQTEYLQVESKLKQEIS